MASTVPRGADARVRHLALGLNGPQCEAVDGRHLLQTASPEPGGSPVVTMLRRTLSSLGAFAAFLMAAGAVPAALPSPPLRLKP